MSHDIGVILNLQSFVTFFLIPIFFNIVLFDSAKIRLFAHTRKQIDNKMWLYAFLLM